MKIYIQHVASKWFIGRDGHWVSSLAQARIFQKTVAALDFCFFQRLSEVQIRARFDNSAHDIVWPLMDGPRHETEIGLGFALPV
jgi:hypothetical protein